MLTKRRVIFLGLDLAFICIFLSAFFYIRTYSPGFLISFFIVSAGIVVAILLYALGRSPLLFIKKEKPPQERQHVKRPAFQLKQNPARFLQTLIRAARPRRTDNSEIIRLKEKCNLLQDYIETREADLIQLQQENETLKLALEWDSGEPAEYTVEAVAEENVEMVESIEITDNELGKSTAEAGEGTSFTDCLTSCFMYLYQNDLVLYPKRKGQSYIYVAATEFFEFFSKRTDYSNRKELISILSEEGAINPDEKWETVYAGKRVIKVSAELFQRLTGVDIDNG